jgi:hypothetical protein
MNASTRIGEVLDHIADRECRALIVRDLEPEELVEIEVAADKRRRRVFELIAHDHEVRWSDA